MNIVEQIGEILRTRSLHGETISLKNVPLLRKIERKVRRGEELKFILPAFPAKSPSPEKTGGELPDLGEVLALTNLNEICAEISSIYGGGAKIIICSDGRVFSEIVKVSDDSIDRYNDGIRKILDEYDLRFLQIFTMEDIFPEKSPVELREILLNFYAMQTEEVRNLVIIDPNYRELFNGIHRFLLEDEVALSSGRSKSAITKETKKRAYELLRRSDAWSSLLNEHFRDALRLSIHPHPMGHEKFGIKLVPGTNNWATPWHNVTVKINNQFELMHRRESAPAQCDPKARKGKVCVF